MAQLDEQSLEDDITIVPMAWHVDYWNYLGWKDPYSSARYSHRQKRYSNWLSTTVSTPQMVVNGVQAFVGSNREKAKSVIRTQERHPYRLSLNIRDTESRNKIQLRLKLDRIRSYSDRGPIRAGYAITEDHLSTDVKSGENAGKTLKHVGVVRRVQITEPVRKSTSNKPLATSFRLKQNWNKKNLELIAFLQNWSTGQIIGVTSVNYLNS